MRTTNTIIIGAGQCGLTMSQALSGHGIDHITLDGGQVAQRWRSERWDSLRMLTPNWMNTLDRKAPAGHKADGFMQARDVAGVMERFVRDHGLDVREQTRVISVTAGGLGYIVQTDQGALSARNVVIATGACAIPNVPQIATAIPVQQVTSQAYKRPADLNPGGVLVVGASASGLNIARELRRAGRDVTVAVGSHMRLPRTYRGADICMWMHLVGAFADPAATQDELDRLRRLPSLPLVGNDANETVDLNALQSMGCRIVGRLCGAADGVVQFSGALANQCASADLKMTRLLDRIDAWIGQKGFADLIAPGHRPAPTRLPAEPCLRMDLARAGIGSVVWATGYRPDHSFVDLPVFDRKGRIRHDGGVVGDGLYVMGLPHLRTARSTHVDGAREDAAALAQHLTQSMERSLAA